MTFSCVPCCSEQHCYSIFDSIKTVHTTVKRSFCSRTLFSFDPLLCEVTKDAHKGLLRSKTNTVWKKWEESRWCPFKGNSFVLPELGFNWNKVALITHTFIITFNYRGITDDNSMIRKHYNDKMFLFLLRNKIDSALNLKLHLLLKKSNDWRRPVFDHVLASQKLFLHYTGSYLQSHAISMCFYIFI